MIVRKVFLVIKMNKLLKANERREQLATDTAYYLYKFICRNRGLSGYEIAKNINWTTGKVHHYLQILLRDGLIHNSTAIVNGRAKKSYSPKSFKELYKEWVIEDE